MATVSPPRAPRLTAVMREEETVTPLELFFDLVFVLALTQCTALMADQPTWEGLAKGLLVLGVLWWSWVGYAWLTSVIDPEEGVVRLAIFGAMAAFLVAALCVPEAFDDSALLFACAYGVVRFTQIGLFVAGQSRRSDAAPFGSRSGRRHGSRCRTGRRRLVLRRCAAGGVLGARADSRHGRAVLLRLARAGSSCPGTSPSGTG